MHFHHPRFQISLLNKLILSGILSSVALASHAAEESKNRPLETAKPAQTKAGETTEQMTVWSQRIEPGTKVAISAEEMQKNGVNDFSNVMRYQPLISANGSAGGSSAGKSSYDRGGSTGYNIRGLDANRVSIDVDGVELPTATDRSTSQTNGRSEYGSYGIGRGDYLDPYMYGSVDIVAGTTEVSNPNNALGGSVSFRQKSPNSYLKHDKYNYFGYQTGYDSSNHSWHNGITAAGGDNDLRGIIVISRRDGNQTKNHDDATVKTPDANWHSNAVLASGIWQATDNHQLTASVDYYHKTNHTHFPTWSGSSFSGYSITGTSYQSSQTRRYGTSLEDLWTPDNFALFDVLKTKIFYTKTEAHDATYETPSTMTWTNNDTQTVGIDANANKDWGRHQFSYGLNARTTKSVRPLTQTGSSIILGQPQADSDVANLGLYLQDTMTWDLNGHDFSIIPGVRWAYQRAEPKHQENLMSNNTNVTDTSNLYSTMTENKILPSISFQYKLKPDLAAYVQYKRGIQFPTPGQLYGAWSLGYGGGFSSPYAILSSPELKTETSNNYELGLKGQLIEGVTFGASTFYNDYQNFIGITRYSCATSGKCDGYPNGISTVYQYENRDKAYIYGAEVSAKFALGTWFNQVDGMSTSVAFGYSKGAAKSSFSGDQYVDLDSVAPMRAILGLAYDDPEKIYGAAVNATFNKGKRASDTGRNTYSNGTAPVSGSTTYMNAPGYGVVDLTAYYRLTKNVRINGGVYNLTDRKYWDYLSVRDIEEATSTNAGTDQNYYNQQLAIAPGRNFQLGVNVDF